MMIHIFQQNDCCFQASLSSPMDFRQRRQQQEHSRNRLRAAQEELCQVSLETGIPCHHRDPTDAEDGSQ